MVSAVTNAVSCATFGLNSLFDPCLPQFTCLADGLGEGNILMALCNGVRTAQTLPPRLVLPLISVALKFHSHRFWAWMNITCDVQHCTDRELKKGSLLPKFLSNIHFSVETNCCMIIVMHL